MLSYLQHKLNATRCHRQTDRQTDRQTESTIYKSTLDGTLRGISFISVLIQRDSARTVVMTPAMTVVSHHEAVLARPPFTAIQTHVCTTYTVVAKSQH